MKVKINYSEIISRNPDTDRFGLTETISTDNLIEAIGRFRENHPEEKYIIREITNINKEGTDT